MKKYKHINKLASLAVTVAIVMSCGGYLFADEVEEPEVVSEEAVAEESVSEEIADEEETDPLDAEVIIDSDEIQDDESEEEELNDESEDLDEFEAYEEIVYENNIIYDGDFDNDYLAEQYIMSEMSVGSRAFYSTYDYSSSLSIEGITVFNYLRGKVQAIADGDETNTQIEIPASTISLSYTASDLGLSNLSDRTAVRAAVAEHLPFTGRSIMNVLLNACPYEMYWFDKTQGLSFYYYTSNNGRTVTVNGFSFEFPVAREYQGGDEFTMNSTYGESVSAAAQNARNIIDTYAGLNDYEKLLAYNNQICLLTDYNHSAAGGGANYGNPWQLVWVFDGDPSTTVVCEGYSKAFQYLCDNSVFRCDGVYAISVSGMAYFTYNYGPHMWNIVHMDDGRNYLVDVTNNDPEGDGNYGSAIFLVGADSGDVLFGYTIGNGYRYDYDEDTHAYFSEAALTLADSDYEYDEPVEGIEISETNFPDVTFRSYVSSNCDANSDGILSQEEILAVTDIDFGYNATSCHDLTGIEY